MEKTIIKYDKIGNELDRYPPDSENKVRNTFGHIADVRQRQGLTVEYVTPDFFHVYDGVLVNSYKLVDYVG